MKDSPIRCPWLDGRLQPLEPMSRVALLVLAVLAHGPAWSVGTGSTVSRDLPASEAALRWKFDTGG